LEFRKILEVGTIRLSAVFRSPENLEELGQLILAMKEPSINSESYAVLDLRFHMEIARASQNQIAVNVYQMLASILKKHQSELNRLLGMSFSVKEHENILLALKEGSPELSAYFMEKHLMRTISELRQYLSHTDKPK
jgi:GntR family transcriptional repressor for pyruvate dehydrogenase complex